MMRTGIASPCPATTAIPTSGTWRRRRSTTSSTDQAGRAASCCERDPSGRAAPRPEKQTGSAGRVAHELHLDLLPRRQARVVLAQDVEHLGAAELGRHLG